MTFLLTRRSSASPIGIPTRAGGGDAMLMLGRTDGGRMLLLVYEQKTNGVVRVYSAREQTDNERRTFRRLTK